MTLTALEPAASHPLQLAPAVLTERIGAGASRTPVRQTTLFAGAWGVLVTAVGVWAFGSSHLPAGVVAGAMAAGAAAVLLVSWARRRSTRQVGPEHPSALLVAPPPADEAPDSTERATI